MGIAERREREREALRQRIVEAARDIVSDEGLDALSMRALAERIEYSPATIYLYFKDKVELLREVVERGLLELSHYMRDEIAGLGEGAGAAKQHRALGRAYARFGLENTAYFRVMFELPSVARMDCPPCDDNVSMSEGRAFDFTCATVRRAVDEGMFALADPMAGAVVSWGLVHGLTSLFLGGHLAGLADTREQFMALVDQAGDQLYQGWAPRETDAASAPYGASHP